ncbi:MAG: dihydrofolate reductase family protein [Aeromicrobium sp.]
MATVMIDLSVSLDGYIAGPADGPDQPLGEGGAALFAWMGAGPGNEESPRVNPTPASQQVIDEWLSNTGALIVGRRTFDIARGWAEGHPIDGPIFVLTHQVPQEGTWSPRVTFVTEGFERAYAMARDAAGDGVVSLAGADVARQGLEAGVVDEIQLSIAPVLLGGGVRLLDGIGPVSLEQTRVIEGDAVVHLRYRVGN